MYFEDVPEIRPAKPWGGGEGHKQGEQLMAQVSEGQLRVA